MSVSVIRLELNLFNKVEKNSFADTQLKVKIFEFFYVENDTNFNSIILNGHKEIMNIPNVSS